MCQATVYVDEEKVMEDVTWIEPTAGGFLLCTFFGEPQEIKGTLVGIDLLKHRILLTDSSHQREEKSNDRDGETARPATSLDRAQPGARQ